MFVIQDNNTYINMVKNSVHGLKGSLRFFCPVALHHQKDQEPSLLAKVTLEKR